MSQVRDSSVCVCIADSLHAKLMNFQGMPFLFFMYMFISVICSLRGSRKFWGKSSWDPTAFTKQRCCMFSIYEDVKQKPVTQKFFMYIRKTVCSISIHSVKIDVWYLNKIVVSLYMYFNDNIIDARSISLVIYYHLSSLPSVSLTLRFMMLPVSRSSAVI